MIGTTRGMCCLLHGMHLKAEAEAGHMRDGAFSCIVGVVLLPEPGGWRWKSSKSFSGATSVQAPGHEVLMRCWMG